MSCAADHFPDYYEVLGVLLYTHCHQAKGNAAKTVDDSPRGLLLTTRIDLRPGQRIRVVSDEFQAVGKVTRSARQQQGFRTVATAGVAFLTMSVLNRTGRFVSRRI